MAATGQAVSAGIDRAPDRAGSPSDGGPGAASAFPARTASRPTSLPDWLRRIHPATWLLAVFLLFLPAFTNDFMQLQVFGWAFVLGMIALSLMFLAGYGGMVSLVQMTVAACAGYMYAIFGHSAFMEISLGWPWWATIPVALVVAVVFGTISGALAVRTEGIYTIMITLAIASAFFYFTRQNYTIFNGFSGFNAVKPPPLFGVDWKQATPFYYLSLFFATASYLVVLYVSRSSFGLALQGVRDNARRMEALGFNVTAHRIAAYSFAAVIAGIAGNPAHLAQRTDFAGDGGNRSGDRHPHHRRRRRSQAPHRAVHRGLDLCRAPYVRARRSRCGRASRRAVPVPDWPGIPADRAVLSGRGARALVALACPASAPTERALAVASVAERLSAAGTANALELRGVSRLFGALVALDDVTMSVRPGETARGTRLQRRREDDSVQRR